MKITSVNNELVKECAKLQQRKYRDESGLFLLEGEKCIDEAIECGIELKHIFILEDFNKYKTENTIETTETVLSKISTTTSAPKCVGVGRQIKRKWSDKFNRVVLLENIKDAGNLGTILRTSCAFGVDAIILFGDTVDLYNPKCVRASVGNLWKVPVYNMNNIDELKNLCKDFIPVATLPKSNKTTFLKDFTLKNKLLLMFGTESSGLSRELIDYSRKKGEAITIEMSNKVESLNLSMSVGIILYNLFSKEKLINS